VNSITLHECRLPINRKERYYTATVFPGLVCAENFRYFDRFLTLLNLGGKHFDVRTDQFFTEYGLAEALFADKARVNEFFPDAPGGRDTPDIVILITNGPEPLLIAIEAKMYGSFFKGQLEAQMDRQEKGVLVHLRNRWPRLRVVHAALLPKLIAEAKNFGSLRPAPGLSDPRPVITWEGIHAAFKDVESAQYFLEVLNAAISKFPCLKWHDGLVEAQITGENKKTVLARRRGFFIRWAGRTVYEAF
jgi:hypothetical protein